MSLNISFRTPRTDRDWFLYYLFDDADFIESKNQILSCLNDAIGENYQVMFLLARNGELLDRLLQINGTNNCLKLIKQTAVKFEVPESIIELGLIDNKEIRGLAEHQPLIRNSDDVISKASLAIEITPYTTQKDIQAIWFIVEEKQKQLIEKLKLTKHQAQSGENPKLIYAIYKLRLKDKNGKRKTFAQIFDLYEKRVLPLYSGVPSHNSSDSLKRYFYTHMPKWDGIDS